MNIFLLVLADYIGPRHRAQPRGHGELPNLSRIYDSGTADSSHWRLSESARRSAEFGCEPFESSLSSARALGPARPGRELRFRPCSGRGMSNELANHSSQLHNERGQAQAR